MQYRKFGQLDFTVSAVGLGTWAIGGTLWGEPDAKKAEEAVEKSIEAGITLIDTAPVYGFGEAESLLGRVLNRLGKRKQVLLATKFGLEWDERKKWIRRNSSKKQLMKEIDESRRRLQTEVIDIYQIHWPDESVPYEETMECLYKYYQSGTIRAIGVSNFSVDQMERCLKAGPLHSLQSPYNLFEREIDPEILSFCQARNIAVLGYGALCRGLLSGKFDEKKRFPENDLRNKDPKFQGEVFKKYLSAVDRLKPVAETKKMSLAQFALRWAAEREGITVALVGARNSKQAEENALAFNYEFTAADSLAAEKIIQEEISQPIGAEFMAPPRSIPA